MEYEISHNLVKAITSSLSPIREPFNKMANTPLADYLLLTVHEVVLCSVQPYSLHSVKQLLTVLHFTVVGFTTSAEPSIFSERVPWHVEP